ncbi:MAG: Cell surface lipoprotein precursor [Mucilaginibacter sp.]|nr:Cell surface lipoprotein precursor [Mucilaginibacter sp.]
MKRPILLVLFILLGGSSIFAQKVDSSVNKLGVTKNGNGALMSPSNNIMDNLSSSPEFSVLVNAIKTAGLTDTFNGNNAITIFAPTNKAFEKLESGKLDTLLLPVHQGELTNLLQYHAIAGRITSKDIERQIKAGNGQAIFTTLSGGVLKARINENRNIALTDENGDQGVISKFGIPQSNGILHIISSVLTPRLK